MSDLETKERPHPAEWQAESLRLTAFLSPSAQIGEQDWWKTLIGELPDSRLSQPRTGIQQEEGTFKDDRVEGKLILTIQPTRIDWQLVPPDIPDTVFSTTGSLLDSLDSFLSLMLRWLENAPQVQRLAFGASLLQIVNDYKEGSKRLSVYLPFNVEEDSSDLFYQINRPRKSNSADIPNLMINRLSKWNVVLLASIVVSSSQPAQYISQPAQLAVRLELDINTAADFSTALPAEQLPQIFQELVELGREITREGDIK
ncbi:MAG TPA: hypothetical protein V6C91_23475 [Coleofasciculaceae cyanobacterium]